MPKTTHKYEKERLITTLSVLAARKPIQKKTLNRGKWYVRYTHYTITMYNISIISISSHSRLSHPHTDPSFTPLPLQKSAASKGILTQNLRLNLNLLCGFSHNLTSCQFHTAVIPPTVSYGPKKILREGSSYRNEGLSGRRWGFGFAGFMVDPNIFCVF